MRRSGKFVLALAACALLAAGLVSLAYAAETKEITLTGKAVWNGNKHVADFKAVLTPTGTKQYNVVYTVTWEKATTTWKGTMTGDLKSGEVDGSGAMPNSNRTFIFQTQAVNGVMNGKHWETTGGKKQLTGDIGLKP